ncbi:MAG: hypothetical protein ACI93T_000787 [Porticoccaceae bacterium]
MLTVQRLRISSKHWQSQWHTTASLSKIAAKCPPLRTTLVELSNPHEVATRSEPNPDVRLQRVAGISCQLGSELKLLAIGFSESSPDDSSLA